MTRSAFLQTASAPGTIVAPADRKSGDAASGTGLRLDEDRVAVRYQLLDTGRNDTHPILVVLDFSGNTYSHGFVLS